MKTEHLPDVLSFNAYCYKIAQSKLPIFSFIAFTPNKLYCDQTKKINIYQNPRHES